MTAAHIRIRRYAIGLAPILVFASRPGSAQAPATPDDIMVRAQRGSIVSDAQPLARLDARTVADFGAHTLDELLKAIQPMTRAASGGDPIYLINGQRIGGFQELNTLPPEAVSSIEVLPEQAALKFGYPATRKVVNVITKPRFAQAETWATAATTSDGGGSSEEGHGGITHIANGRRFSLNGGYRHAAPLFQSERDIAPDPTYPFDTVGNITAAAGGEIDPSLSAAAGHPVTIAAVPADPAQRSRLAAYLPGADRPRPFDLGPYRTLVGRNDKATLEGVLATPIAKNLSGTLSFSAERTSDHSLQGLPIAAILVPATDAFSPFGRDVILNRSLDEAGPLTLRTTTSKLNLAGALHGMIGHWNWDLTGALDSNDVSNHGPNLVDVAAIDRAVAEGIDPFADISPDLLATRTRQYSRSINRKASLKTVASGVALNLPAGDLTLTTTAEAERATARTSEGGLENDAHSIGRSRIEGGLALDVPLVSRDQNLLPFLGQVSLSLSANVRHVQGYGTLNDASYGLLWSPTGHVQLIGTIKQTGAAPTMELRSAPVVQTANVPFFDSASGRSVLVTTIAGGNPDLPAERRTARNLSINWRPLAQGEMTLQLAYGDELIRHQALQVTALTPATQAAFPGMFVRDAAGQLTTVLLQPVDFYRERQRTLLFQANWGGPIGKPSPKTGDPKSPPPDRVRLYLSVAVSPFLSDRLELRPGSTALDLLDGDAFDASATRRSMGVYSWNSIHFKTVGMNFNGQWIGGLRVDGGSPQSDLYFGPLLKLDTAMFVDLGKTFPTAAWAHKCTMFLELENALNRRQRVEDGTGATPNRYQADYLDPLGRTVKLTLRRTF